MRITAVSSGAEMDEVLQRQVVDCIVLDLKLPGEAGPAIARRLREQCSIPILMLTGCTDEADRLMGLDLGAADHLTKPFSPRELLARIRALLRRVKLHSTIADKVGKLRAYRFEGWELNLRRGQKIIGDAIKLFAVRDDVDAEYTAAKLRERIGAAARQIPIDPKIAAALDLKQQRAFIANWKGALAGATR